MTWRDQYRKCDCVQERVSTARQAQSYCSPRCKRAAAYGRERFAAGKLRSGQVNLDRERLMARRRNSQLLEVHS
jgi:hypothetical protein